FSSSSISFSTSPDSVGSRVVVTSSSSSSTSSVELVGVVTKSARISVELALRSSSRSSVMSSSEVGRTSSHPSPSSFSSS
ncbi:hypothetical protein PFISCL1PPCAC_17318, partial [Pristionchus fissidentatus]